MSNKSYQQKRLDTQHRIIEMWALGNIIYRPNPNAIYAFPTDIRNDIQKIRARQSSSDN